MANEGSKPPKAAFVTALRITVRSGATADAKRLFSQVHEVHQKLGRQSYWTYYAQFGPGETYLVVAPGANLQAHDGPPAGGLFAEAMGGNKGDDILGQLEATFEQQERVLLEYLPDFSNHPDREGDAPGPLLFHTRLTLKPGSTAALKSKMRNLTEHHVKAGGAGRRFWTYGTVAGGNERAYHVITPFRSYEELTTNSDNTSVSAIAENELTDIDSHIETIERTVLEYLPGFSNPPAA